MIPPWVHLTAIQSTKWLDDRVCHQFHACFPPAAAQMASVDLLTAYSIDHNSSKLILTFKPRIAYQMRYMRHDGGALSWPLRTHRITSASLQSTHIFGASITHQTLVLQLPPFSHGTRQGTPPNSLSFTIHVIFEFIPFYRPQSTHLLSGYNITILLYMLMIYMY